MHVIYIWRDLQNDLGTKDIDAYLTESEEWPGELRTGAAGGFKHTVHRTSSSYYPPRRVYPRLLDRLRLRRLPCLFED